MQPNVVTPKSDTDVLIVGAGPVGLTMACELQRRGIRCRIIDKSSAPGTSSRALGTHERTLELFDKMGIIDRMVSRGVKGYNANFYVGQTLLLTIKPHVEATDAIPYPYVLVVPQSITEAILIEFLHELGGTVERPKELVDLRQEEGRVTATVNDFQSGASEELTANWLIGCDGAHSRVRHLLGLAFEGSTYDEEFVLADLDLDWNRSHEDTHLWLHQDGEFVAIPLPKQHWRLIANVSVPEGGEAPSASLELCQQLMRERTDDTTTTLSNPIWMSNFKISRRMVQSYRQGRIFVAGDAAHVHSPFGGQGMNTGIQDACNLGWKLALVIKGKAAESLLDTYQAERPPIARKTLQQTHTVSSLVFSHNPLMQFVRLHVAPHLLNVQMIHEKLIREASELELNYRTSPLSRSDEGQRSEQTVSAERQGEQAGVKASRDFRHAPHAGDRAPDGRCLRFPSQEATTLFAECRGTRSHLLVFTGLEVSETDAHVAQIARQVEASLPGEITAHLVVGASEKPADLNWDGSILLDPEHTLHTRYGASVASLYFIRPDGYIGYRSQPAREEPLMDYLGSHFLLQEEPVK